MTLQSLLTDLDRYAPDQTIYVPADTRLEPATPAIIAWQARGGADRMGGMVPMVDVWHAREIIAAADAVDARDKAQAVVDAVQPSSAHEPTQPPGLR